jgi:hypothetical protein
MDRAYGQETCFSPNSLSQNEMRCIRSAKVSHFFSKQWLDLHEQTPFDSGERHRSVVA